MHQPEPPIEPELARERALPTAFPPRADASELCPACGEQLLGPDADTSSWQSWGAFWESLGMSNVELVCGACSEYLREVFRERS